MDPQSQWANGRRETFTAVELGIAQPACGLKWSAFPFPIKASSLKHSPNLGGFLLADLAVVGVGSM